MPGNRVERTLSQLRNPGWANNPVSLLRVLQVSCTVPPGTYYDSRPQEADEGVTPLSLASEVEATRLLLVL